MARLVLVVFLALLSSSALHAERMGYPSGEFSARRDKLAQAAQTGLIVMFGATEATPGLRFRQDNDFFYLTGNEALNGVLVIDVGTGSGVLAIAASLLGAVNVRGIDDDEDAIHAAWDNLSLNPAAIVTLLVGDLRTTELEPADIVFGNLTGGLLMASAAAMGALAGKPHGRLILSGFQTAEEQDVVASFAGFVVQRREQEDDWVCVTLKHAS